MKDKFKKNYFFRKKIIFFLMLGYLSYTQKKLVSMLEYNCKTAVTN